MSLLYIVDAYNLINHPLFNPSKKSSNIQQALADFIKSNKLTGSKNNRTILVFDGYLPLAADIPQDENLSCRFSRSKEADELIKKIIEESAQPRNLVVVSDDKEVQIMARLLHAQVCAVGEFICGKQIQKKFSVSNPDSADPKLTYSKMQKINVELAKKWLK